jgi:hypothetical protein
MEDLYAEDLRLGQLTAVQEIVAGMAFDASLGAEILQRMQPWFAFAERLANQLLVGTPLGASFDPAVVGTAVIALYLGLEIVARMRRGDTSGSTALVATLAEAAPWIDQLLGKTTSARRRTPALISVE